MSRQMTPAEKAQFHSWFPSLNVDQAVVTGEATTAYNCISWTVGVTNAWLWPGPTIQQFDSFYARYGLRRSTAGPVAAWGISTNNMTHGSVTGPGHGPRWESKCGSSLRIQHGLNELVSSGYGRVVAFYSSTRALSKATRRLVDAVNEGRFATMPTSEQLDAVRAAAKRVPSELRKRFDQRFTAWKETWSDPHIAISSDPRAVTHVKEFHDLIELGRDIIPAVVEAMIDPDNFFVLQLYDALQSEHHMVLSFDPASDDAFEGEQGRARRTVERFASSL
jgi:hypothetical protein